MELVNQLDAEKPQVMIQVVLAQITLNSTDEFGMELGLQDSVLFNRSLLRQPSNTHATRHRPRRPRAS